MDELKEPNKITEAMKGGLARMYADTDFRDYISHTINIANHNVLVCLKGNQPDKAKEFGIEIEVLRKLMEKGKLIYSQSEKLKQTPLSDIKEESNIIS